VPRALLTGSSRFARPAHIRRLGFAISQTGCHGLGPGVYRELHPGTSVHGRGWGWGLGGRVCSARAEAPPCPWLAPGGLVCGAGSETLHWGALFALSGPRRLGARDRLSESPVCSVCLVAFDGMGAALGVRRSGWLPSSVRTTQLCGFASGILGVRVEAADRGLPASPPTGGGVRGVCPSSPRRCGLLLAYRRPRVARRRHNLVRVFAGSRRSRVVLLTVHVSVCSHAKACIKAAPSHAPGVHQARPFRTRSVHGHTAARTLRHSRPSSLPCINGALRTLRQHLNLALPPHAKRASKRPARAPLPEVPPGPSARRTLDG